MQQQYRRLDRLCESALEEMHGVEYALRGVARINHKRVLDAFRQLKVSDFHFNPSTGYGYGDTGRKVLEELYARVFGGESALVRSQIVSGTHAIFLGLKALAAESDALIFLGPPYDTLKTALNIEADKASTGASGLGIPVEVLPLTDGAVDTVELADRLCNHHSCLVAIQRSAGYDHTRASFDMDYIAKLIALIKGVSSQHRVLVDNCYGEFTECLEPPMVGADLTAGSLIKNPGGGIAPGGGYLVGSRGAVDKAAHLLTAPGLGKEVGASFWDKRLVFQGLFLAPLTVLEALCGMAFSAALFAKLGFGVFPGPSDRRTDIIQRIDLGRPELLAAFCRAIQNNSPVDSQLRPEPAPLPGYAGNVIMAAGTFVQGASLELSADAPLRSPYSVFLQGGLSREYTCETVASSARALLAEGLLVVN